MKLAAATGIVILLISLLLAGSTSGQSTPATRVDALEVHKAERSMVAYWRGAVVGRYRVAIGGGDAGPKRWEGDRRTPEGVYRIDRRHHSRNFHRFLHVSYPNRHDRVRYRRAKARGNVPAGRSIGSAIGIHGEPRGITLLAPNLRWSWTDGCIAVSNREIEQLYESVIRNARLEIHP